MDLLGFGIDAVERGLVPDPITRMAIRRLCGQRARAVAGQSDSAVVTAEEAFAHAMSQSEIAPLPELANAQHYELPPEFFAVVLGPRRKYSCCFFPAHRTTLAEAEDAALDATCARAELHDGQDVLELGCGWGSLSLWMAERYPTSRITAVSNSSGQREYIESVARTRGLKNLRVITADMNEFAPASEGEGASPQFDRVVSVEMFEHMRNYERLLERIAGWLRPDGKLFVHIFCHRRVAYAFETAGAANWMGRYFFTGGIMPSRGLLRHFARSLRITKEWEWSGHQYQRTANAWLANLDSRRGEVLSVLEKVYGRAEAKRWFFRWRMFFLAVAEMFGWGGGREWFVAHYLLEHAG